jgi:hypothetical protein
MSYRVTEPDDLPPLTYEFDFLDEITPQEDRDGTYFRAEAERLMAEARRIATSS